MPLLPPAIVLTTCSLGQALSVHPAVFGVDPSAGLQDTVAIIVIVGCLALLAIISKHCWYSLSCCLAVVAGLVAIGARLDAAAAIREAAKAASDSHNHADWFARRAEEEFVEAAAVLVLGVCAWVCSLWRREPGLQIVPRMLLFVAGVLYLVLRWTMP